MKYEQSSISLRYSMKRKRSIARSAVLRYPASGSRKPCAYVPPIWARGHANGHSRFVCTKVWLTLKTGKSSGLTWSTSLLYAMANAQPLTSGPRVWYSDMGQPGHGSSRVTGQDITALGQSKTCCSLIQQLRSARVEAQRHLGGEEERRGDYGTTIR